MRAASASFSGLPSTSPATTTAVSAPSTISPGPRLAADALSRASRCTKASGGSPGSMLSGTFVGCTTCGMPADTSSSWRRGDADARINISPQQLAGNYETNYRWVRFCTRRRAPIQWVCFYTYKMPAIVVCSVRAVRFLCVLALAAASGQPAAAAIPQSGWTKTSNQHFEIFSQTGEQAGRQALAEFEQLRAFFEHIGLRPDDRSPVRVIGFRSPADYDAYRLRPAADAYFAGTENRNYIVMPNLGTADFGIAAHEYVHLVLHANGLKFPAWLSEGLAEFFSSVRINDRQCVLGNQLSNRIEILERNKWLALPDLLSTGSDSPRRDD